VRFLFKFCKEPTYWTGRSVILHLRNIRLHRKFYFWKMFGRIIRVAHTVINYCQRLEGTASDHCVDTLDGTSSYFAVKEYRYAVVTFTSGTLISFLDNFRWAKKHICLWLKRGFCVKNVNFYQAL
jgi:hypothetical protein